MASRRICARIKPLDNAGEPATLQPCKLVEQIRNNERVVGRAGVALRSRANGADPQAIVQHVGIGKQDRPSLSDRAIVGSERLQIIFWR